MRQEIPVRFILLIFFLVLAAYFIPLYAKKGGEKHGGENLNEHLERMPERYWEFCFDVT